MDFNSLRHKAGDFLLAFPLFHLQNFNSLRHKARDGNFIQTPPLLITIINHHFLYKTSNFTLTSPNPITKTNHKPFFYQCESLHIFMFTYLSHYPVLFYYNTLPSIIPETFSPIPTPKDTLHKNIFDIPRPGILLLVPGL